MNDEHTYNNVIQIRNIFEIDNTPEFVQDLIQFFLDLHLTTAEKRGSLGLVANPGFSQDWANH